MIHQKTDHYHSGLRASERDTHRAGFVLATCVVLVMLISGCIWLYFFR
jgi:hypothetical protein